MPPWWLADCQWAAARQKTTDQKALHTRGTPATLATPMREGATAACRPCAQLIVALCLVRSEPLYVLDSARPGASGYDAIC